jgi:hypothetical protein
MRQRVVPTAEVRRRLFRDIMADKIANWGMVLYEQDWLITTYEGLQVTQANVTAAHDWLMAMSDAAAELNVTIQVGAMPSRGNGDGDAA